MKLIQWGNSKLPNMLMWNIPASKAICGRVCPGCYSYKFYKIYPNVLPAQEERYQASLKDSFVSDIVKEIGRVKKPFKYFRIHASAGEFYSNEYILKWVAIAKAFPHITFYAYTKRLKDFDFSQAKALPNFIVIDSLHGGKLNYGPLSSLDKSRPICPDTLGKDVQCGISCTTCMDKAVETTSIQFVIH